MKTPSNDAAKICMDIRIKSKIGKIPCTEKEIQFCEKIFKRYPEWYAATEKEIFEKTKPFGAQ